MIFSSFVNLYVIQKIEIVNCIYKLNNDDKILSSLIKKLWQKWTFLNHLREANEHVLCALFLWNRLCCYSFLYRTSLTEPSAKPKLCKIDEELSLPGIFFFEVEKLVMLAWNDVSEDLQLSS